MHARPTPVPLRVEHPELHDGPVMWHIARAAGLDENSRYKYLLFCRDFAATSAVARAEGETVGFVTGYRRPDAPDTLFVWQIGVLGHQRGHGVAARMLDFLLTSTASDGVRYVEATVTPQNAASVALFEAFARRHGAPVTRAPLFGAELFTGLHEDHDEEVLLRIGAIPTR